MSGGDKLNKLDKEKMIKKEIAELKRFFKEIENDKKPFANRLIEQCSFMSVTLRELQETLNEDGAIELFVNGKQKMLREHPATKTYNAMVKNYNSVIKQLLEMLPEGKKENDELMEFLRRDNK